MEQKRLPAVMAVALGVHFALAVLYFFTRGTELAWMSSESWYLAMSGIAVAGTFALAAGGFELATRSTPGRGQILRIVATAQLVVAGLEMSMGAVEVGLNEQWVYTVTGWIFSALVVGAAVGYTLAARGTAVWWLGFLLVPCAIGISPPPPLLEWIWEHTTPTVGIARTVIKVAYLASLTVMLVHIARASTVAPPDASPRGLTWLHGSIRTRVIAIGVLVAATAFAASAQSRFAVRFVLVGPVLVNIWASIAFAAGAALVARGARRGVEIALAVAVWLSAWIAGVIAYQVAFIYGYTTDKHVNEERYEQAATALSVPLKVAVVVAIAVTLVALYAHFTQRGNLHLARFIRIRATVFVVLMTLAYTVAEQIFKARSASTLLTASVLTAAFGIAALLTAASAFKRAATSTGATELPTATLVTPD